MARFFGVLLLVAALGAGTYGWWTGQTAQKAQVVDVVGDELLIMTVQTDSGEWIAAVSPSRTEKFVRQDGKWFHYEDGSEADSAALEKLYTAYLLRQQADEVISAHTH